MRATPCHAVRFSRSAEPEALRRGSGQAVPLHAAGMGVAERPCRWQGKLRACRAGRAVPQARVESTECEICALAWGGAAAVTLPTIGAHPDSGANMEWIDRRMVSV